ncbi:MAG: hypothetical protein U5L01_05260 [Rheinheimera sp.]|nr:hypothetical protein [Rheinheimera sp.]
MHDFKTLDDDGLLALLASLDRRRDALLIHQVRSELGVRRVYFTERLVNEQGHSRLEISRRTDVVPSRGQLLPGSPPIDWTGMQGERVFGAAILLVAFGLLLPSTGFIPAYAVSDIFLLVFYSLAAFVAMGIALFRRASNLLKWWAEQLLLLCNVGLLAFALQIPVMLLTHHLLATPWQQHGHIIDLQRNSEWYHRSLLIEFQDAVQAPIHFCQLSTADFDLLRPNDPLLMQGSHSAIATVLERIVLNDIQQPPSS